MLCVRALVRDETTATGNARIRSASFCRSIFVVFREERFRRFEIDCHIGIKQGANLENEPLEPTSSRNLAPCFDVNPRPYFDALYRHAALAIRRASNLS